MGNLLCNESKVDASEELITNEEVKVENPPVEIKTYNENNLNIFKRIQLKWKKKMARKYFIQSVPILDNNLQEYGKFITKEEMEAKISEDVKKISYNLPVMIKEDEVRTDEGEYLIYRKPFEYNLDKSVYRGFWNKEGKREGYGVEVGDDGSLKEGLWKNGFLLYGRMFESNGSYYEGEISNNYPHGVGKRIFGNQIFSGEWENGFQTKGGRIFDDGYKYTGEFKLNMFNGQGVFTWPDGSSYEGEFTNSSLNGHGKFISSNGDVYEGEWCNNLPHGKGIYHYAQRDGDGVIQRYEGSYYSGKKDGYGEFYGQNNTEYRGTWKNGVPHGEGEFKYKDQIFKGVYRFGRLIYQETAAKKVDLNLKFLKENLKEKEELKHLIPDFNRRKVVRTFKPSIQFVKGFEHLLINNGII